MEITEKSFWEEYWGNIELPKKVDFSFKNDNVIANTILQNIPKAKKNEVALEIGCAPGKWMLLFYEYLNYDIEGFEYLETAAKKTIENLVLSGVNRNRFNVKTSDFLEERPVSQYQVVSSFGFVEHFENYQEIIKKHFEFTINEGYVVIGFPNFRGLNYYIQKVIDSIAGTDIIANHNIHMMDIDIMKDTIQSLNKEIIYIDYIGGLEFGLFNMNAIRNIYIRYLVKILVKILSLLFKKSPNKYIASYLIIIARNREF